MWWDKKRTCVHIPLNADAQMQLQMQRRPCFVLDFQFQFPFLVSFSLSFSFSLKPRFQNQTQTRLPFSFSMVDIEGGQMPDGPSQLMVNVSFVFLFCFNFAVESAVFFLYLKSAIWEVLAKSTLEFI